MQVAWCETKTVQSCFHGYYTQNVQSLLTANPVLPLLHVQPERRTSLFVTCNLVMQLVTNILRDSSSTTCCKLQSKRTTPVLPPAQPSLWQGHGNLLRLTCVPCFQVSSSDVQPAAQPVLKNDGNSDRDVPDADIRDQATNVAE